MVMSVSLLLLAVAFVSFVVAVMRLSLLLVLGSVVKAVCLLAVPMVEPVILMVIVVTLVWAKVVSAKLGSYFMPPEFIYHFCF